MKSLTYMLITLNFLTNTHVLYTETLLRQYYQHYKHTLMHDVASPKALLLDNSKDSCSSNMPLVKGKC